MDKRYQIFISSTFEDLKDERQAILKAVLMLNHMPAGMELFPAVDDSAWRLICDVIDASDYYVLIIGGRYGSLDEKGISYTEKEYDYALKRKKPVISLLHSNPNNLPRGKTETDEKAWRKLVNFRKKVEKNHTRVYWKSADDLKAQAILGLTAEIKRNPGQGWTRTGALSSEEASNEIIRLRKIIDQQKDELDRLNTSLPEWAEKLAQGSDKFEAEFRVTLTKDNADWQDAERTIKEYAATTVTWDEIFAAFAPSLMNPTRETQMKSDIARMLREKSKDNLVKKHKGYTPTQSTITETLFRTFKVQFLALGLIESKNQTTGKDEKKEIPVCELTSRGKDYLISVTAVHKK